jgi:hypothetical protein
MHGVGGRESQKLEEHQNNFTCSDGRFLRQKVLREKWWNV